MQHRSVACSAFDADGGRKDLNCWASLRLKNYAGYLVSKSKMNVDLSALPETRRGTRQARRFLLDHCLVEQLEERMLVPALWLQKTSFEDQMEELQQPTSL